MDWIKYCSWFCSVSVGGLGMYVSIETDWAKDNRIWIMAAFFLLTAGSIIASEISDSRSKEAFNTALADLKRFNENEEAARKKQAEIQTNFLVPLKNYIKRGEQNLRDLQGSPAPGFASSQDAAIKWHSEVAQFLQAHCSDPQEGQRFLYQPKEDNLLPFNPILGERYRDNYPQIYNKELLRIVGFYEIRLEYLRKQEFSGCQ